MMDVLLVLIFVAGYADIALEHRLRVDKAAIALLMFGTIWTVYACCRPGGVGALVEHLGSTCETLVFLIGAMTIVEIIDSHGGFGIGVDRITMLLLGLSIKEVMFLFRGPNRLDP